MLSVSERTVERMFKSGELARVRPGGKLYRTTREIVDQYVQRGLGVPAAALTPARTTLRRVA